MEQIAPPLSCENNVLTLTGTLLMIDILASAVIMRPLTSVLASPLNIRTSVHQQFKRGQTKHNPKSGPQSLNWPFTEAMGVTGRV